MQKKSENLSTKWGNEVKGNKRKQVVVTVICLLSFIIGCNHTLKADRKAIEREVVNPWTWQNKYGFVQANKIRGAESMLFCAGQISVDKDGKLLFPGDMSRQVKKITQNLEVLFKQAGFKLSDIVRITYYTTDIKGFTKANLEVLSKWLKKNNCKPATSLIGVAALAHPACTIELEVTAVMH